MRKLESIKIIFKHSKNLSFETKNYEYKIITVLTFKLNIHQLIRLFHCRQPDPYFLNSKVAGETVDQLKLTLTNRAQLQALSQRLTSDLSSA